MPENTSRSYPGLGNAPQGVVVNDVLRFVDIFCQDFGRNVRHFRRPSPSRLELGSSRLHPFPDRTPQARHSRTAGAKRVSCADSFCIVKCAPKAHRPAELISILRVIGVE